MKKYLIIGLVILLLAPFYIVQTKKRLYENKIEHFLTEVMLYGKEDIQSIEGKWHFAGLPKYWVNVVFSDEPNVVYVYFAHDKEQIGQFEYYSIDSTILSTDKLKHYEPYEGDKKRAN
ncbi:DUF3139 domain-containing protein [Sporosarcina sp. YIM B06819]|uniref:DUF3139 domain-containing protein n=1 Tax=Sporosarcina sp. YIM B06819 TaxID=3081769 RepID=UPI00298BDC9C|nr:DUF3139 domain-containing protein [Sporosarcina sp. YIM B06819]